MDTPMTQPVSPTRVALVRAAGLFALWILLIESTKPADLAFGALAAGFATWTSLRLLPPAMARVRFGALAARLPRFLWQSIMAGADVARRALDPRLPLASGYLRYRTGFQRGPARCAFATITSLLPGTVPVGDDAEGIEYHCLDTSQPVADELEIEERRYARALDGGARHG